MILLESYLMIQIFEDGRDYNVSILVVGRCLDCNQAISAVWQPGQATCR